MTEKRQPKPKLTDAERHQHFKKMAIEVGASDDAADFDKAFEAVTATIPPDSRRGAQ